jgi:exopolysaccharide biosynthesis polyprenyl glycosylphosphotransferase
MAHAANVLDFRLSRKRQAGVATPRPSQPKDFGSARLIPGLNTSRPQHVTTADLESANHQSLFIAIRKFASFISPFFLENFAPSGLGNAVLDLVLISAFYACETRFLRYSSYARPLELLPFCFYLFVFFVLATQHKIYGDSVRTARAGTFSLMQVNLWTTVLVGFAFELSPLKFPLLQICLLSGGTLGVLVLARNIRERMGTHKAEMRRVLIIGEQTRADFIAAAIRRNPSSRYIVTAVISETYCREFGSAGLGWIARERFLDGFIIATADANVAAIAIEEARRNHLEVRIVPELFDAKPDQIVFERIAGVPVIKLHEERSPEWMLALKRIADIALATSGLFVLVPLMLAIAALIRLDSPGPALYRAPRVGRKGQRFTCYKFRTMTLQADLLKDGLRSQNQREGAFFKMANDPRITRLGRLLRRYSLDELPQLWNVLRGEMSLVGPRPHPPDDVSRYQFQDLQRLDFIPGITGLWQVTARKGASFERSVALDVEYIRNWSLWLDFRILCRTIFAVLQGSGA